jgi:uncharacterized protein YceK
MMKKITLFILLLLLATSCATVGTTTKTATTNVASAPVYYTGKDEPAASGMFVYADEN